MPKKILTGMEKRRPGIAWDSLEYIYIAHENLKTGTADGQNRPTDRPTEDRTLQL